MTAFKIPHILIFLFLMPVVALPQSGELPDFEGTVHYKIKLEGRNAAPIELNEPNDVMVMHIKEGNYIIRLSGGRYPKDFIFVSDSNREYSVDMANQIAYQYSSHADLNRENYKKKYRARPTGKTEEIRGIPCQEYIMKKEETLFLFYVSDEYRVDTRAYEGKFRARPNYLVEGLDGRIPLKTIRKLDGLTVTTTCTKIERSSFSMSQFRIPDNFEVKKRDYRY